MNTEVDECRKFCTLVARHPDITNATARIGAWLFGVAELLGRDSLEVSYRDIRDGFVLDDHQIEGTGSHIDTIKSSIEWLENKNVVETSQGRPIGFGHFSRVYKLVL